VVFVSPLLIYGIGEQLETLKRTRSNCLQLIAGYNSFVTSTSLLNAQAILQQSIQFLSAQAEFYTLNSNPAVGGLTMNTPGAITPPFPEYFQNLTSDCKLTKETGTAMITVLKFERICAIKAAAAIRDNIKNTTIGIDYLAKFQNAQQAIDTQAREIAHALFALDSTEIVSLQGPIQQHYQNGTWVQKGTVILSIGP
jgi:hypothetical protein